jgi:hypothetical protein
MLDYRFHHDYSVAPAGVELFSDVLLSLVAVFAAPSPLDVALAALSVLPDSVAFDPSRLARESVLYHPDPLKTMPAG